MKFDRKTILAIVLAALGAAGINVAISDDSPIFAGCDDKPVVEQPVAGASAPSGFAGSLASDEDAGAK